MAASDKLAEQQRKLAIKSGKAILQGCNFRAGGQFELACQSFYFATGVLEDMVGGSNDGIAPDNFGEALDRLASGSTATDVIQICRDYAAAVLAETNAKMQLLQQEESKLVSSVRSIVAVADGLKSLGQREPSAAAAAEPSSGAGSDSSPPAAAERRTAAASDAGGEDTGLEGSMSFEARMNAFKPIEMSGANCVFFDDLVGSEDIERKMMDGVVHPMLYPNLFRSQRGMLLFGPPGTGKTFVVKAAATQLKDELAKAKDGDQSKVFFFSVSGADLTGKYVGESEKQVKAMWLQAQRYSNTGEPRYLNDDEKSQKHVSIIFLDEADSVLKKRSEGNGDAGSRVAANIVNVFLAEMDGIRDRKGARIYMIAATNYPSNIDAAVMRRFPTRVFRDLPTNDHRRELCHNAIAAFARNLQVPAFPRFLLKKTKKGASQSGQCIRSERSDPFSGIDEGAESALKELVLGPAESGAMTNAQLASVIVPDDTTLAMIESVHKIEDLKKREPERLKYEDKHSMAGLNFSYSDVDNAMRGLFEQVGSGTLEAGVAVCRRIPVSRKYMPMDILPTGVAIPVYHLVFTEYDERLIGDQAVFDSVRSEVTSLPTVPLNLPSRKIPSSWLRRIQQRATLAKQSKLVPDATRAAFILDLGNETGPEMQRTIEIMQKTPFHITNLEVPDPLQPAARGLTISFDELRSAQRLFIRSAIKPYGGEDTWSDIASREIVSLASSKNLANIDLYVVHSAQELSVHLTAILDYRTAVPMLAFSIKNLVIAPPAYSSHRYSHSDRVGSAARADPVAIVAEQIIE